MKIGRFPFTLLAKYPHMSREDTIIWEEFVKDYPNYFDSVDFDLPVGDFRKTDIVLPKEWAINREYLGKMKIDVVGYKGNEIYIIEVKPQAWAKALGQVIMYDFLYTTEHSPTHQTRATILTDEIMPNMPELCAEHFIKLIVA